MVSSVHFSFVHAGSAAAVTWAHHAILAGKEQQAVQASVATVTLAIVFTVLQVMEYLQAPLTVPDGIHGSTFYSATGFHGLHAPRFSLLHSILKLLHPGITGRELGW